MNGKSKPGRPRLADPRTHRYNFKLNDEENIRFCRMLAEVGLEHNRSRFIVKRIFAEKFRVVRIDTTLDRYLTRLNQFNDQLQRCL
ncbi:plasmid mobilization protein, partial [Alistipes putredinis]|uniref:plasmid mobilization protein n=1 Tax=Alistipes putredinis TaxID=28117 RepID=UPI003FEF990C